ncbi:putative methyltransferase domain-containing protein [Colletotrichum sublineola]|uniref:Putative methyltransferase domain-containing protein n=1 Tax=Colletotrichum sublineola TaxID=1173701 RepID=A0A066XUS5_COLSU|nr:putative methyltransferase domain-containing protein [Colletotrichum sublineola]
MASTSPAAVAPEAIVAPDSTPSTGDPTVDNDIGDLITAEEVVDDGASIAEVSDALLESSPMQTLTRRRVIRSCGGRLGTAPPNAPGANVGRVLDLGTGSGIWAMDFGDEHPEADVLGVDLSPSQPEFVTPNVKFEIDDVEEPWTYSIPFDYIHSRGMTSSISNWDDYLQQAYNHLSPGGYLELIEIDPKPSCDDDSLPEDSPLVKSVKMLEEAATIFGRPFVDIQNLKDKMVHTGFEDVHIQRFKWPTNGWPKDRHYKEIGIWNYENFAMNWEAFVMAPLTRAFGWSKEEVLIHVMEVRKDLGNRNIHAYFSLIWDQHEFT